MEVFIDVGVVHPRYEDAVLVDRHIALVRQQESGEQHGDYAVAQAERRSGPHLSDVDGLHARVDDREHFYCLFPKFHKRWRVLLGGGQKTPDTVLVLTMETSSPQ